MGTETGQARKAAAQATIAEAQAPFAERKALGEAEEAVAKAQRAVVQATNQDELDRAQIQLRRAQRSAAAEQAARTRQSAELDLVQAQREAVQNSKDTIKQRVASANTLRDDYRTAVERPTQALASYQNMLAVENERTAPADLALIIGFTKLQDPSTAAQRGEVDTVISTVSAFFPGMRKKAEGLVRGEQILLSDDERAALMRAAKRIASTSTSLIKKTNDQYAQMAREVGVPASDLAMRSVSDFSGEPQPQPFERALPGLTIEGQGPGVPLSDKGVPLSDKALQYFGK